MRKHRCLTAQFVTTSRRENKDEKQLKKNKQKENTNGGHNKPYAMLERISNNTFPVSIVLHETDQPLLVISTKIAIRYKIVQI